MLINLRGEGSGGEHSLGGGGIPLETRKVRIQNDGLLHLYWSRGAVGHALPDIRERVTKLLKRGGHVGLL